jgi:hypothetical protein
MFLRGSEDESEVTFRWKVGKREKEREREERERGGGGGGGGKSVWYITVAALPDLLGAHFSVAELTEPTQLRCSAYQLTRGVNREEFGRKIAWP